MGGVEEAFPGERDERGEDGRQGKIVEIWRSRRVVSLLLAHCMKSEKLMPLLLSLAIDG